jgi:hypothetical protein
MRIVVNKNWQAMCWHKVRQWRSEYLAGNAPTQDVTIEERVLASSALARDVTMEEQVLASNTLAQDVTMEEWLLASNPLVQDAMRRTTYQVTSATLREWGPK